MLGVGRDEEGGIKSGYEEFRHHDRGPKGFGEPTWNFEQGNIVRYMFHEHHFSYSLENGLNRVRWIQENHQVLTLLIKVKSDECLK